MSFSAQKLHFSIKIPIQNHKQPNKIITNHRTKPPQTTEQNCHKQPKSCIKIWMTLLQGETPRLIDEWQTITELWDTIRNEVDKRNAFSQFILTGSTVAPQAEDTVHSGTGRIGRVKIRPMSLYESGDSTGSVSLAKLFDGETFEPQPNSIDLERIAFLTCRGGWPQATLLEGDIALDQAFGYVDDIAERDINNNLKYRR